MFVRPSVVRRLSFVVCHAQKRLSCTLGTLRYTVLGLSAPHLLSKIHESVSYVDTIPDLSQSDVPYFRAIKGEVPPHPSW